MADGKIDQLDGIQKSVSDIEEYLRKAVMWGRIIIIAVLALSLILILIYNFFAPSEKDVSQDVIDRLLKTITGAEAQTFSSTLPINLSVHGST